MTEIIFLTSDEVLEFHKVQLRLFGGRDGIRDRGLLESAIMGPQASFQGQYLNSDIYAMAAAYAYGIIKNHPFFDGNKRTGMTVALAFLYANDAKIDILPSEVFALAIAIAASEVSQEAVSDFFKSKGN